jgi:LysM repeat protein
MGAFRQSSLRALAPAALVVFAIVFLIIVIASLSGGDDSSSSQPERISVSQTSKQDRERARQRREQRARQRAEKRGFYIVRAGDNLFTIANKTGVPVETLRALNPTLDPQGLVTGQHVRLPVKGEKGATGATGSTGTSGAAGAN